MSLAQRIFTEATAFMNFAYDGFKYNLQVLPDVLTASSMLFALLFQSPPMAVLAVSMASLNVIHGAFSSFLGRILPNTISPPSDVERCSGRFPGVSYTQLLGLGSFGAQGENAWPSYYATFIGFLAGWVGTLPTIYAQELEASPYRTAAVSGGLVFLGVLCVMVMMYRIMSGCEGFAATAIGLLMGFVIGLGLVLFAAWATERRGTNILGMPLLRSRAADGKPIYVCDRPTSENDS